MKELVTKKSVVDEEKEKAIALLLKTKSIDELKAMLAEMDDRLTYSMIGPLDIQAEIDSRNTNQ